MGGVHLSNPEDLLHVEWPHLNNLVVATVLSHIHVRRLSSHHHVSFLVVHKQFLVDLSDNQIKDGNHIWGVALNLPVQLLIELVNVVTVNIQDEALSLFDDWQLLDVVGLLSEVLDIFTHNSEGVNEISHFCGNIVRVDVCPPKHLGIAWGFSLVSETLELASRGRSVGLLEEIKFKIVPEKEGCWHYWRLERGGACLCQRTLSSCWIHSLTEECVKLYSFKLTILTIERVPGGLKVQLGSWDSSCCCPLMMNVDLDSFESWCCKFRISGNNY